MADTRDLKSLAKYLACGFESRSWHFLTVGWKCCNLFFELCVITGVKEWIKMNISCKPLLGI